MKEQRKMIIFTAPSGAGKTTIVRHLLSTFDFLDFSVSATTRPKRPKETEGKDYYFMSSEEFRSLIANDELAEYEEVYENQFYGTLISEIERIWANNKTIVFDIDVKGATVLKKRFADQCRAVFIAPPSLEILIERLKNRKTESERSLAIRLERVKEEMKYENTFDTSLINDDLDTALAEAELDVLTYLFPKAKLFNIETEIN